jgi:Ca2+-binding RTX toxin-like protein
LHIANVTGSIGNDLLVGDANPNVLIGGTGRNLIIGGGGSDSITGGGGDNILIAGYTSYDQNLTALDALFAEWTSADPLSLRMRDIRTGGGLNGNDILNPTATGNRPATVFDDGVPDLLYDGSGLSWFFVHEPDDLINNGAGPLVSGDVVAHIH